jgi:ATP-dependent exoDNAse (exonuclease V) beta subunit
MNNSPELLVYKASAGSGKTFTLAVEFIKRLIVDPRAYREILAVTFTNKATGEMKERILSQLYGICVGDEDSQAYLDILCQSLGRKPDDVRQRAGEALRLMIHDYNRFRVETIDSFFQSVMRHLARELELGANLRIELDNELALSDAVDAMIEHLDRQSPVLHWILEFIDERINDDKRWDVTGEIKKFGRYILDEEYVEKGAGLREKLKDPECIRAYREDLRALLKEAEEQMKGFAQQFFEVLEGHGLTVPDLNWKEKGVASYFRKLEGGTTDDSILTPRIVLHTEGPECWAGKSSPRRAEIVALAESELLPLLLEAEKLRPRNSRIINSCRLSLRYVNQVRLLTHIDEEMRRQNHEQNRFLLAATNALLHRLVHEGDSSFVYEKLGTSIRHVMIDEFQDTSKMQWQNFRQLLNEGLSQGEDSLIVGDVKQSIYRWRNGDWRILNGLRDRLGAFPVRVETLTTNRRSEGRVIRFNNALFRRSVSWLNTLYRTDSQEDCTPLMQAYADVEQLVGKRNPDVGYVEVSFLPKRKDLTYTEDTMTRLAAKVDELVKRGVSVKDIAILVRKNRNIPEVARFFDEHTPYKIVSDEAFRLDASPAVRMIIAALRCLTDAQDGVSLAELAVAYQREVLHLDVDLKDMLMQDMHLSLPRDFIAQADQLRMMPLYELTERLAALLQLERVAQQEAYLCAFFDAVTSYLDAHSSDLSLFLTYWDEKLAAKTIPSGEVEGVRILSIHKSKGLEYHTVLIPYCDWALEKEPALTHTIWCAPGVEPFNRLDILPVDYSKQMNESVYQQDYLTERVQLWVDNLNVLYVALTRAKCNLIIWSKAEGSGTVAEMMRGALDGMDELPGFGREEHSEDCLTYRYGELCPSAAKAETAAEDSSKDKNTEKAENLSKNEPLRKNKLLQSAMPIPLTLESIQNPVEFKQSNRSKQFIAGDDSEDADSYIHRGLLLHALFSEIRTPKDIPAAIERLRFEGLIRTAEDEQRILKLTEWALGHPKVKEWFGGEWELYNECAILFKDEDGNVVTRRPDRVMRRGEEVVVVDFKFGKKRASYHRQVKEYMELIRRMGFQEVKGYLWYVYLNELEEITTEPRII